MFKQLDVLARGSLKPGSDCPVLDGYLVKVLTSPKVVIHLTPLAGSNPAKRPNEGGSEQETELSKRQRKARNRAAAKASTAFGKGQQIPVYIPAQPKGGGKGVKGKVRPVIMPAGLHGGVRDNGEGPLCFAHNLLQGCPNAQPGQRCPRGLHKCAKPGCREVHSFQQHSWPDKDSGAPPLASQPVEIRCTGEGIAAPVLFEQDAGPGIEQKGPSGDTGEQRLDSAVMTEPGGMCRTAPEARCTTEAAGWVVEVCAGSAKLTAACKRQGFSGIGVDSKYNRHRPVAPVAVLDLTLPQDQERFWELLKSCVPLVLVWMGLPCGTGSRSREIKWAANPHVRPIRSEEEPWGRTDVELTEIESLKLHSANVLYRLGLEIIAFCRRVGAYWAVENPRRALLWWIPGYNQLLEDPDTLDVDYHACMHGGQRRKAQKVRTNCRQLGDLAVDCDDSHPHLPWSEGDRKFIQDEAE